MTYETWDFWSLSITKHPERDPRVAIARHIGWIANTNTKAPTEWKLPEPVNYNHAVKAKKPIDCPLVKDAVYYKNTDGHWWSIYYVTADRQEEFKQWLDTVPIDVYWYHNRPSQLRPVRGMLYARKNQDLTENERLYSMGYYSHLSNKYFSLNDTMLLERLGPVRTDVLDGIRNNEQLAHEDDIII